MTTSHTYVLVHGAWHGGWCWSRVTERLRQAGHQVYTPTLPGLGERRALLSPAITLETFIQDLGDTLRREDLHDVTLVGHSFGGLVVSGVADQQADRIRRLVYLDAFLLPPGRSTLDTLPAEIAERLVRQAAANGGIPPLRPASLGLTHPDDMAFVEQRMTPQPIGSYQEPLRLDHPLGNGLPVHYLRCTEPIFAPVVSCYDWAREQFLDQWAWADLATGHDAMISAPDLVAQALMTLDP